MRVIDGEPESVQKSSLPSTPRISYAQLSTMESTSTITMSRSVNKNVPSACSFINRLSETYAARSAPHTISLIRSRNVYTPMRSNPGR